MVIFTVVPFGLRMRLTASRKSSVGVPSTLTILSSRLDAGPVCRRTFDRGNDGHQVVAHGDVDTDAGEFSVGVYLQLFQGIGGKQEEWGSEAPDHALNGCFDHFLGIHLIHIVFLNQSMTSENSFRPL